MKRIHFILLIFLTSTATAIGQAKGGKPRNPGVLAPPIIPTKYALVIGVSKYVDSANFTNLNYADVDAENFINFLKKGYIPNLDSSRIKYFVNDKAVEDSVIKFLRGVVNNPDWKPGDELYVYFSGHGVLEPKENVLIWHDIKMVPRGMGKLTNALTGIKKIRDFLEDLASTIKVKVYFIIDACRNRIEDNLTDDQKDNLVKLLQRSNLGEVDFYATHIDGVSYETKKLNGSGVFTYFLLMGLEGAADSDDNKKIDAQELNDYLSNTVNNYVKYVIDTSYVQRPDVFPTEQLSKVTITDLNNFMKIYRKARIKADSMQNIIDSAKQAFLSRRRTTGLLEQNRNPLLEKELNYGYKMFFANSPSSYPYNDDTSKNSIYQKFRNAISNHQLVRPEGKSAYDYFLLLKKVNTAGIIEVAQDKLFYALYDAIKEFVTAYLDGDLVDAKRNDFEIAYEETIKLMSFLGKKDILLESLQTKLYFFRAQILALSNDPTDWQIGINLIDSALNKEKTAFSYLTKAILFSNKSRFFSAISYLDTALIYAPNWKFALFNLATTNYKIQEYGKSITYCRRVLSIDSNYSRMYSWLAYNYETLNTLNNYKLAIEFNQKALQKDSSNAYAYLNLGRIYSKLPGNYYENLQMSKYYYQLGGFKYKDYHCLTMLGSWYLNSFTRSVDSAEYFYNRSLKLNPYDTSALSNYAYLLVETGRKDSAQALFSSVLVHTKRDYRFLAKYRSFAFKVISPGRADTIFKEAIGINHQDPSIFIEHSEDYKRIDSLNKAKEVLLLGMSYIDSSPSLNNAMASLFFKKTNDPKFYRIALDSSKYYLKISESLTPLYSVLQSNLSVVYSLIGKKDSSALYARKADSLNLYINFTNNFSRTLNEYADSLLAKQNYTEAFKNYTEGSKLYRVAYNSNDSVKSLSSYNFSRYYYLQNRLKLAKMYCNRSINYLSNYYQNKDSDIDSIAIDSSFSNTQEELRGLIEFEFGKRGKFKNAKRIFQGLFDDTHDYKYFLEKAVCDFELGNKNKLFSKAAFSKENSVEVYNRIASLEDVYYSRYFMEQLSSFIRDIDTSYGNWYENRKKAKKRAIFNHISFNSLVIKSGMNYSSTQGEPFSPVNKFDLLYGLAYELPITKKIGLQPEIIRAPITIAKGNSGSGLSDTLFYNKGGHIKYNSTSFLLNFTYKIKNFLFLNTGPQFSYLLNHSSLNSEKKYFKTINTSMDIGLTFKYRNLRIYSSYLFNLTNLNSIYQTKGWRSRQLSLAIGLQIF